MRKAAVVYIIHTHLSSSVLSLLQLVAVYAAYASAEQQSASRNMTRYASGTNAIVSAEPCLLHKLTLQMNTFSSLDALPP